MSVMPVRKSVRLAPENYLGFQQYFVTLCCYERQKLLSDEHLCKRSLEVLQSESSERSFCVPAYRLMPDHLHFLAEGIVTNSNFLHFMKSFKIKDGQGICGTRIAPSLAERVLRTYSPLRGVLGIRSLVYPAESCEERDGCDATGVPIRGILHRYGNASRLVRRMLETTVEEEPVGTVPRPSAFVWSFEDSGFQSGLLERKRSASEGGPYNLPARVGTAF